MLVNIINGWMQVIGKIMVRWFIFQNLKSMHFVLTNFFPILYINSLGLPVCDVTFYCIIIFYVSAAKPAIGKNIFVWNWHPWETRLISTQLSVRPSVCDRAFRPVNDLCIANSAAPQKWAAKTDSATYLLLFLSFFWICFFGKI